MSNGIIASITEQSGDIKTGTVTYNAAGDVANFEKENIACGVGDPVSFTLTEVPGQRAVATDLKCLSGEVDHALNPLKTPYHGDITIGPKEKLVVEAGGEIKGNVNVDGGKLLIEKGGDVKGEITVSRSGSFMISGGTSKGNVNIQDAALLQIGGGGDVKGEITVMKCQQIVLDNGTINGTVKVNSACDVKVQSSFTISCAS